MKNRNDSQVKTDRGSIVSSVTWKGSLKATIIVAVILAISFIIPIIFIAYFAVYRFFGTFNRWSVDINEWAQSATFLGFLFQTMLGIATIAITAWIAIFITQRIDDNAKKERGDREIIRLSEKMVDPEFYIKVMYPAWEVALKWLDDTNPDIERYRAKVISGELRLPKFYSAAEGEGALFESYHREHPHFLPYDIPASDQTRGPIINELSESLALATWVRFWCHVAYLKEVDIISETQIRSLFREWYMWWAPFMVQFVDVLEEVSRRFRGRWGVPIANVPQSATVERLRALHRYLGVSEHCGFRNKDALGRRTKKIAKQVVDKLRPSLAGSENKFVC